jgi:RNA polymerase sigma-70 factor, ECF subfamily
LSEPIDALLIERLRSGDRAAWDSLFTTYSESVWRYVAKLLGSDAGAVADVVQDAFQAIIQSIAQFDPTRGSIWSWMTGIAHNRAMLYWRGRRRDRLSPERVDAESNGRLHHWFNAIEPPSSLLEQQESAELVRHVLAELPADYSYCLVAKYVEDRSAAEIAESLGESVDAIRSRLTRARGAFKERIQRADTADSSLQKSLEKGTRS